MRRAWRRAGEAAREPGRTSSPTVPGGATLVTAPAGDGGLSPASPPRPHCARFIAAEHILPPGRCRRARRLPLAAMRGARLGWMRRPSSSWSRSRAGIDCEHPGGHAVTGRSGPVSAKGGSIAKAPSLIALEGLSRDAEYLRHDQRRERPARAVGILAQRRLATTPSGACRDPRRSSPGSIEGRRAGDGRSSARGARGVKPAPQATRFPLTPCARTPG